MKIIVSGNKYTDIDVAASAFGYREYLNANNTIPNNKKAVVHLSVIRRPHVGQKVLPLTRPRRIVAATNSFRNCRNTTATQTIPS
jgi:inorganic pyrophosphatase/exopolyphosphatase